MEPAELFRHILAMAAADGHINDAELEFLSNRAMQLGIKDDEFEQMLQDIIQNKSTLEIPPDKGDRRTLMKDLVRMMAADGKLDQREKMLFARIAAVMDLSNEELHHVIDATLAEGS